jgi:hypothetical protein
MMMDRTLVALPCKLSPGAVSGERVFEVAMANSQPYVGIAPRYFCWNASGQLVGEKEPETEAPGLVAARVVDMLDGDQLAVEVPDGEVIAVKKDQIEKRPTTIVPPSRAPTRA